MKPSQFNIVLEDKNELVLFNSIIGIDSLCRVSQEKAYDVRAILNGDFDRNKELTQILIREGYLIEDQCDERKRRELIYSRVTSGNMLELIILPTERCNFRCKYCYEDYSRGAMSAEIQRAIIKYVRKNIHNYSGLRVSWFGGEPLLSMDVITYLSENFINICKKAKRKYIAGITTNGYLLTEEVFRRLLSYHVIEYQITIDGVREIHDSKRPLINGYGTFDVITSNLSNIKNNVLSGTFGVVIRCNVTEDACDGMDDFINYFKKLIGDDQRFSFFLRPVGNWGGNVRMEEMGRKQIEADQIKLVYSNFLKTNSDFKISIHESFFRVGGCMCYAGNKNSFVIDSSGGIRKCTCGLDNDNYRIGFLQEKGIMEIDEEKYASWVGNTVRFSRKCDSCKFSPLCFGMCCPRNNQIELKDESSIKCPSEKDYILDTLKFIEGMKDVKYI